MRFESLERKLLKKDPLLVSVGLHLALAFAALGVFLVQQYSKVERVEFTLEDIDRPLPEEGKLAAAANPAQLQNTKPQPVPPPSKPKPRAVFGVSRQALTTDVPGEGVVAKQGNTVAKEEDNLKLNKDDADALPNDIPPPVEEFLVSRMPMLLSEFRIPYPEEARKNNIQGAVVMEILVDQKGNVRKVKLVSGPGFGLNEAAVEAVKKIRFSPAELGAEKVAVWMRYSYKFVLEK